MTYVVPKNVVVQMGTVDADTLCGLPCSYYLDYNNLKNTPDFMDPGTAEPGSVLVLDENGNPTWTTNNVYGSDEIDGGGAYTVFSASENKIDGVSAYTTYLPGQQLTGGTA